MRQGPDQLNYNHRRMDLHKGMVLDGPDWKYSMWNSGRDIAQSISMELKPMQELRATTAGIGKDMVHTPGNLI